MAYRCMYTLPGSSNMSMLPVASEPFRSSLITLLVPNDTPMIVAVVRNGGKHIAITSSE